MESSRFFSQAPNQEQNTENICATQERYFRGDRQQQSSFDVDAFFSGSQDAVHRTSASAKSASSRNSNGFNPVLPITPPTIGNQAMITFRSQALRFEESIDYSSQAIPVAGVYPPCCLPIFPNFQTFNRLQSKVLRELKETDDNIVVSAPTGSGKTTVFEMAITKLLESLAKNTNHTHKSAEELRRKTKIVYVAPNKALCEQMHLLWKRKFERFGMKVLVVTGDSGQSSVQGVVGGHLILTTPEKLDSITRRWREQIYLMGDIKLLLIDEIHLLGDLDRGGVLESVICRMKNIQNHAIEKRQRNLNLQLSSSSDQKALSGAREVTPLSACSLRIVAVSATLPNSSDIGAFLNSPPQGTLAFDDSYRPVPLQIVVKNCGKIWKNEFLFNKGLGKHVKGVIDEHSGNKPTIVFCHTKKDTEVLAEELSKTIPRPRHEQLAALRDASAKVSVNSLKALVLKGCAYHHAGLSTSDREVVEALFLTGFCRVLASTSTLAMGVNLPARLVVIKGTRVWRGNARGNVDIEMSDLLQMMGRAGRPGFDTTGVAVILTDEASVTKYENLKHRGLDIIESQLMGKLTEAINTEVNKAASCSNSKHSLTHPCSLRSVCRFRRRSL
mgnify:CR=1 FL=1